MVAEALEQAVFPAPYISPYILPYKPLGKIWLYKAAITALNTRRYAFSVYLSVQFHELVDGYGFTDICGLGWVKKSERFLLRTFLRIKALLTSVHSPTDN